VSEKSHPISGIRSDWNLQPEHQILAMPSRNSSEGSESGTVRESSSAGDCQSSRNSLSQTDIRDYAYESGNARGVCNQGSGRGIMNSRQRSSSAHHCLATMIDGTLYDAGQPVNSNQDGRSGGSSHQQDAQSLSKMSMVEQCRQLASIKPGCHNSWAPAPPPRRI